MWHAPFCVYRRQAPDIKSRCFYVQFWDSESRRYRSAISINSIAKSLNLDPKEWQPKTLTGAQAIAIEACNRGFFTHKRTADLFVGPYLETFWDWDTSAYIQGRLARKANAIGKHYCKTNRSWVIRYVTPYLGNIKLEELTTAQIEQWFMNLRSTSGLHAQTLNSILKTLSIGLKEAFRLGIIESNPAASIQPLGVTLETKGLLDTDELKDLLAMNWNDPRGYLAFAIALVSGLRIGEIQALQVADLGPDHLIVRHSWSKVEGLKCPKNKKTRIVPLPQALIKELKLLAKISPSQHPFIFWDETKPTPISSRRIERMYYEALQSIGIPDSTDPVPPANTRQGRALYFHGLRHQCNALLRGILPDDKLQSLIGHADISMTRLYDHMTDLDKATILDAQNQRLLSLFPSGKRHQ